MNRNYYAPGKQNPHLPHDAEELKSMPIETALANREADLLVSQLMQGHTKPGDPKLAVNPTIEAKVAEMMGRSGNAASPRTIALEPAVSEPAEPRVDVAQVSHPRTEHAATPVLPKPPVELRDEADVTQDLRGAFPRLSEQGQEAEPTFFDRFPPIYFVVAAFGVLAIFAPALLFGILAVALIGFLVLAALFKAPGLSQLSAFGWRRFARRSPERAERVRQTADSVALGFEYVLDMLPGSLADKLALPDFSQPVPPKR